MSDWRSNAKPPEPMCEHSNPMCCRCRIQLLYKGGSPATAAPPDDPKCGMCGLPRSSTMHGISQMSLTRDGQHYFQSAAPPAPSEATDPHARKVKFWTCPDCAFSFDAFHTDEDGGYSCPNCAEATLRAELERVTRENETLRAACSLCDDEIKASIAEKKRNAELTALRAELTTVREALRRVAPFVGHKEEPGEVCADNCLRCAIDAALPVKP